MNKTAAIIITAGLILLLIALFALFNRQPNTQVTTSPNLQASAAAINWGTLQPGETVTRMLTLTNIGNADTQPLTMTHTATVGAVAWNLEGATLQPNQTQTAAFMLEASYNAPQGAFNFTITLTG